MRTFASETSTPVTAAVLSVSALEADHAFLEESAWSNSELSHQTSTKWKVYRAFTVPAALHFLRGNPVPVVLCADELAQGTWKELLEQTQALQEPPSVILSSRLADDSLWAEAINLGVYDVLAKPFISREVSHIVAAGLVSWLTRRELKKRGIADRWAVEQWNAAAG